MGSNIGLTKKVSATLFVLTSIFLGCRVLSIDYVWILDFVPSLQYFGVLALASFSVGWALFLKAL